MDNSSSQSAAAGGGEHSEVGTTQVAAVSGTPVGQITAASQPIHVTHTDGSTEDLGVGGQIYANDVIRTQPDGEVEITFVDNTKFSLGGNAEMQIDKLIYDPSGSDNSLALSVVQGAFVFVTGTIAGAPGEGMEVTTPAGSIGVRGTSVGGHYAPGPEGWVIALLKDADGHVGKVVVFNGAGEVTLDELFESTKLTDYNTPPTTPVILSKDEIEALFGVPLELLPEIEMQIQLEGQRGELDVITAAGGDGNHGGPNHGSHFYTFGLANFIFGAGSGTIPPTALGAGTLDETRLLYETPDGLHNPDDKQNQDFGPFGLLLEGGHIPENSPFGTVAGHVAAILGGPPNATYSFSLVDQDGAPTFRIFAFAALTTEGSPAFEIDPVTGVITVHNPELMDFETTPEFLLTVRATDSHGQSIDVPFQVHLEDVNDNAPVIEPHDPIDLAENSAIGTVVGQVVAHDVDTTGEPIAYSIVGAGIPGHEGDYAHYFQIDPETGEITLTEAGANSDLLDYESGLGKIVLQVVASDGTNGSSPMDVEIDITNVDEAEWSISGSSFVSEGGTATYTVSYSGETLAPGETMTIDLQTQPGSADEGSDYSGVTTTLTFTGGESTSMTVAVSTVEDTVIESDENYSVIIGNPSHGNVAGDGEVVTTIGDGNDTILSWQIEGNSAVEEGHDAIYTVSYTGATLADGESATVTVHTYPGGGAEEGEGKDYIGVNEVLTFTGGGATAQTISVEVLSDTMVEYSENYSVDLIGDLNTTGSSVTTQILEPVQWRIDGSSFASEGETAVYTVSYSGGQIAPGEIMTIDVQTQAGSEPGSASEGEDYTGVTTTLTFTGGGDTSMTVEVSTVADTVIEDTEHYNVVITNPSHGNVAEFSGETTTYIGDGNDTILSWQIEGQSTVEEGEDAIYTVSYSGAALGDGQTTFVTVQTHGGGAQGEGIDYSDVDQILTFVGGGETAQTIAVETIADTDIETSQDYSVDLSSDIGLTGGASVTTVIHDPVQWEIFGPENVVEGNAAIYTVGYAGDSLAPGDIATVTIDSSSGTAIEGEDYQGVHEILTFTGGGAATQTLQVHTLGDNDAEGDENYSVSISQVDHGKIGTGETQTTIADDDNDRLEGIIATETNHSERPVILTFVDENTTPDTDSLPAHLHAYSRLLVVGSEADITKIDADAGFTVDDTTTYRTAIEAASPEGHLDITGVTLEGVDLGPTNGVTIGIDDIGNDDSMPGVPTGITGILDPETGDALQAMQPSIDGNGSNDTIFGSKGSFSYLFGAGGDDSIEAPPEPTIINGGNAEANSFDILQGGSGDDVIVYNHNAFIDGGGGFDILRVDDGAVDLYQKQEQGNDSVDSSTVDLRSYGVSNMDMILITDDADADPGKGTHLVLDAYTADQISRPGESSPTGSANLFIVGSKGDSLSLRDLGHDWVDGDPNEIGIQPTGHYSDGHGQTFDLYQVASDSVSNLGRITNVYVDTDIKVTVDPEPSA
jgi:hypothetical protein